MVLNVSITWRKASSSCLKDLVGHFKNNAKTLPIFTVTLQRYWTSGESTWISKYVSPSSSRVPRMVFVAVLKASCLQRKKNERRKRALDFFLIFFLDIFLAKLSLIPLGRNQKHVVNYPKTYKS